GGCDGNYTAIAYSDFADLDGDGLLDLITGRTNWTYNYTDYNMYVAGVFYDNWAVQYNQGGGLGFGAPKATSVSSAGRALVTDLFGDGRGVLVTASGQAIGERDNSTLTTWTTTANPIGTAALPPMSSQMLFGDFNGDGLPDALVFDAVNPSAAWLRW